MTGIDIAEARAAQRAASVDPLELRARNWQRIGKAFPGQEIPHRLKALRSTLEAKGLLRGLGKMGSVFMHGFSGELEKCGFATIPYLGLKGGLNLAEYAAVMNLPTVRRGLNAVSGAIMNLGFKHGFLNKKISRASIPALASGAVGGAAPMLMYEQGWEYGRRVAKTIEKVPGLRAKSPLHAARMLDTAAQAAIEAGPVTGTVGGAGLSLAVEKAHHPRRDLTRGEIARSLIGGAALGGATGIGIHKIGPKLPLVKQLHALRTGYIDKLLGHPGKIEHLVSSSAKTVG